MSPTINLQVGDVKGVPLIQKDSEEIDFLVGKNVTESQKDWDAFETSWDFKRHPLV